MATGKPVLSWDDSDRRPSIVLYECVFMKVLRMSDSESRLEVRNRIQLGTASAEDHAKALQWGQEFFDQSMANASLLDKWMMTDGEAFLQVWSDDVFDSTKVYDVIELVYLFASCYAVSDIENGGLSQFFGNSTGALTPEAVVGLKLVGCHKASNILEAAMSLFGKDYPRIRQQRFEHLTNEHFMAKMDILTDQFYSSAVLFHRDAEVYFQSLQSDK